MLPRYQRWRKWRAKHGFSVEASSVEIVITRSAGALPNSNQKAELRGQFG